MSEQDGNIDQFRRQLAFVLACKYGLALTAGWLFVWGTVVLLLRATTTISTSILLWGAAPLPLLVGAAVLLALRCLPPRSAVRALLDGQNHLGGVLMAAEEVPVGQWAQRFSVQQVPAIRWRSGRAWGLLALSLVFLGGGFLVPQRFAVAGRETPLQIDHQVQRVKEQVQILKEEKILEPTRAEEMHKKLGQLKEESRGSDPVKTLEAIDRVQDVAKQKAQEATEAALKKTEQLAKSEALADVLRKKKKPKEGGLSDQARAEAMDELRRLTREAMKDNQNLEGKLDKDLIDALQKAGELSAEQLDQLREALKDAKGDISKMLGKLEKVALIDPDKLKQCEKCGECDGEALLAYLKANEGKASMKELMGKLNLPGRGGVDRGPAPAEISFGNESPDVREKMKEQELPQARLDALKESKLKGVSITAPQKSKPGGETTTGALTGTAGGSGSAQTQAILPQHRGAVERYFERGEKK